MLGIEVMALGLFGEVLVANLAVESFTTDLDVWLVDTRVAGGVPTLFTDHDLTFIVGFPHVSQ